MRRVLQSCRAPSPSPRERRHRRLSTRTSRKRDETKFFDARNGTETEPPYRWSCLATPSTSTSLTLASARPLTTGGAHPPLHQTHATIIGKTMAGSRRLPAVNGFGYLARIDMNEAHEVRHWIENIGCSKDELAAAVARVGNSPDAVRREVYRHWAYGTFPKTKVPRRQRRRPRKRGVTS